MNVINVVVKSKSTTSYFIVSSHMNSDSHLIAFITSPFRHKEEYEIIVSRKTKEIIKHHLYSLNLNYYICIMSGLYGGLFKKHPTTTSSFIHIHGSEEFSHVISVRMISHPWALSPHIIPYLEEWKKLHHVDK